jgi:pyridoxal phosphate enzyme (YggS family)
MKALDRYYEILEAITRTSQKYERCVELMVVTKSAPWDDIESILQAGCHLFGENRLQDITHKWPPKPMAQPYYGLHYIGQIQSNKLPIIFEKCDGILSLSTLKHIDFLSSQLPRPKRYFAQINVGRESQKAGMAPENLGPFLDYAMSHSIKIEGLTAIPPVHADPEPYFIQLKALADQFSLPSLSMGMSGDYITAIKRGSTMVRIGSAIFGT